MIYTITFNPSIDYVVQVKDFQPGQVNRVETDYKYPGGKGINVSRVLNNLMIKNKAMGFIGGFTGTYVKSFLENEGVDTDFINIKGDTRINTKLKSTLETEINGKGPDIEEEDLQKLFNKVNSMETGDFLVLAGNVQSSLPVDIYAQIQERCQCKNIKVIIDTTGEALTCTLKHKPFLIKPNNHELQDIFNIEINSQEDVIKYGRELLKLGAQNVIVSLAAKGAILICSEGVYHAEAPKGQVKNSVGAGDSLIGGFLAKYYESSNIVESFKWGIASGSATAFSLDLCKKEDVEKLIDQVEIKKIY